MMSSGDEDDGGSMLLNFSTDDATPPLPAQTSGGGVALKGGRWKDRRRRKLQLEGREPKRVRKPVHEADAASGPESEPKMAEPKVTGQVVSSLFTSNREITTAVNTNVYTTDPITLTPSNAPSTADSFEALNVKDPMLSHLHSRLKITKPTTIQKKVIPQLSTKENDVFIHAQTGSGKTLAYLLPILSRILQMGENIDRKAGCFALIVAPTRELATQIYQVLSLLCGCCHYLVPCLLIGGERKKSEKARLRKGCNFIIGTPGRVLDHLQNTKVISENLIHSLRYVVLDEGDKLMELGFEETINKILEIIHSVPITFTRFPQLPSRIIHALCSATVKGNVKKLGNIALKDYKLISNGGSKTDSEVATVPSQLLQKITIVPPKLRLVTLAATLINIHKDRPRTETSRTIVFLSCADSVDFHYEVFSSSDTHYKNLVGDSVRLMTRGNTILPINKPDEDPNLIFYKLHGSLSQKIRSSTLEHFAKDTEANKGKHLILFCTDVASRGLDLPHVGTVIEMDPPFALEDHLHRIGRTARAGKGGEALLFLLPGEEEGYMDYIKPYHPNGWHLLNYTDEILKIAFQDIKVTRNDRNDKNDVTEWDTNATTWHLNIERRVIDDSTFKDLASKAYTSHIRAYATHISQEKKYFNIKFLHLGHLAKSFTLRERPKVMGLQNSKKNSESNKKPKASGKNKMFQMARMAVKQAASEFNY